MPQPRFPQQFSDERLDQLGRRLTQRITPADRETFENYLLVLDSLRHQLTQEIINLLDRTRPELRQVRLTSRTKRADSIIAKLKRNPDQPLSQLPDILGQRLVVPGAAQQHPAAQALQDHLDRPYNEPYADSWEQQHQVLEYDDKTGRPNVGYRAIHLDLRYRRRPAEIQVQTRIQNRWQTISELAFAHDPQIKYGGGNAGVKAMLMELSVIGKQADAENTMAGNLAFEQAAAHAEERIQRTYQGAGTPTATPPQPTEEQSDMTQPTPQLLHFLIEHDRHGKEPTRITQFADPYEARAQLYPLDLEQLDELNASLESGVPLRWEYVILSSTSLESTMATHHRYYLYDFQVHRPPVEATNQVGDQESE